MSDFSEFYPELMNSDEEFPVLGIRILAFYDSGGDLKYRVTHDVATENIPISQVIGILEMAKADLVMAGIMDSR